MINLKQFMSSLFCDCVMMMMVDKTGQRDGQGQFGGMS